MNHPLLQKASIITTPTAYTEDYLYSIKPAKVTVNSITSFANGTTYALTTFTSSANNVTSGIVSSAFGGCVSNAITLKKNQKVKVTFDYTQNSGDELRVLFSKVVTGAGTLISDSTTINATGTFNYTFTITEDVTGYLQLGTGNSGHSINFSALNVRAEVLSLADFDFDRNSTGTRVNKDNLIEDVPYNLLEYSQDFTQWTNSNSTDSVSTTLSPDGSAFSTNFAENTSNAQHKLSRTVSFDGNSTYTFSVFVKSNGRDIYLDVGNNTRFGGRASFNLTTGVASTVMGTPSIKNLGNGWFRCMVTGASTSAGSTTLELLTFNGSTNSYEGDGSSGVFVWGAHVVKGNQPKNYLKTTDRLDIPRIDYTNGEPSILLEPSRTNSFTYSNDFTDSAWSKDSSSIDTSIGTSGIQANISSSPEGIDNASRVNFTLDSDKDTGLRETISSSAGTTHSFSVYVKGEGSNIGKTINIRVKRSSGGSFVGNDLSVTLTSNWQRALVDSLTLVTDNIGVTAIISSNDATSCLLYGAQLEEGDYATSLIHTSGSTVTRSADISNNAGNSDLINSTEGVLYLEVAFNNESQNNISLSDGSSSNRVTFTSSGTINRFKGQIKLGGATEFNAHATAIDNTQNFNKYAIKWKENDFALWCNGTEKNSSSSGSTFSAGTLTTVQFDRGDGANDFHGKVKVLAVFKEALTDAELTTLTS